MRRAVVAAALLLLACGDPRPLINISVPTDQVGPPTNTTVAQCAAAGLDGLTYANFGQTFFGTYCTGCHAANLSGAARNGAPSDHNFDTLAGILLFSAHIDEVAAMNPTGSQRNTVMPPAGVALTFPGDADRQKLACFIVEGLAP